jgi:hypothetical protein
MVSSVTQPLTDEQFQRTVEELYGGRPTLTPQAPASLSTASQRPGAARAYTGRLVCPAPCADGAAQQ